jgi:hypothetical protein
MKVKSTFLTFSLAALAAGSAWGQADDLPVSRTAGILNISLPAGTTTVFALPMAEIVASGTVSAVSGATLTLESSPAVLPAGLAAAATPHAIKITSRDDQRGTGANAPAGSSTNAYGLSAQITAQSGQVVTVSLPTAPNVGDEFVVYRLETLNSLFGPTNSLDLTGGSTFGGTIDTVGIMVNGTLRRYWYKGAGVGGIGWRLETSPTNVGDAAIPPNTGIFLQRVAGTTKVLQATGDALPGNERLVLTNTGFSVVNNPFMVPTTLAASGLASFVTGGATAAAPTDIITLESGGVLTRYWYKNGGVGGIGWRTVVGTTPSDSVVVAPGKAIVFQENSAPGSRGFTLLEPFAE